MLTVVFLFSLNLIILAVLQAAANQRIGENARQISVLIMAAAKRTAQSAEAHSHSWDVSLATGNSRVMSDSQAGLRIIKSFFRIQVKQFFS